MILSLTANANEGLKGVIEVSDDELFNSAVIIFDTEDDFFGKIRKCNCLRYQLAFNNVL